MKRLDRWLLRQAKREGRRPRLLDALLGHAPVLYVAHRLRFVTLRVLLRTLLHLLEIVAITRVFPLEYLGPILVLRHTATLVQSLWWGVLEPQRDALRDAFQRHDLGTYAKLSSHWSALSLVAIGLTLLGFASWVAFAPRPFRGFSIYDAYAIACGLRTAIEIWVRTQHSAVFAVARIRRPLSSLVLVDVFEVIGLLIAWLHIGPFAFAVMLVLSGMLRASFTLWFTRATRRYLELPPHHHSVWRELLRMRITDFPYGRILTYATGNAALQLDSIAILLLSTDSANPTTFRLTIALHALAPLFGAGYGWSRVFYFDFKSLLHIHSSLLTKRFGLLLDRIALSYPIVLSLLAWPIVDWLFPLTFGPALWLLGLFIVARSALALRQIEAYSYSDFRVQLRQALVLVVGLGAAFAVNFTGDSLLGFVSTVLLVAAFGGKRARPSKIPRQPGTALSLEAWLGQVIRQTQALRLVAVTVARDSARMNSVRRSLVAQGFVSPMLQVGHATWVMTVADIEADAPSIRRRLIAATAGAAVKLAVGERHFTGIELLRSGLVTTQRLTWLLAERYFSPEPALSRSELVADFRQNFPDGSCLSDRTGRLRSTSLLQRRGFGTVLRELSESGPAKPSRIPQLQLSVYRPLGEPQVVFVLPGTGANFVAFIQFRKRVQYASLQATLSTLFEPSTDGLNPDPRTGDVKGNRILLRS